MKRQTWYDYLYIIRMKGLGFSWFVINNLEKKGLLVKECQAGFVVDFFVVKL